VDGAGSIAVSGGQASFNFHVAPVLRKKKATNSFDYSDPTGGVGFEGARVDSLMISGNHAQFSGTARISRRRSVTFTVDADDFGSCPDHFTIQLSNGYFRSGDLTSGDISIH
jgi:hypothetical protein